MKFKLEKKFIYRGIIAFLVIVASICFYYLIFHGYKFSAALKSIMRIARPISYGMVMAYLLTPVVNKIESGILFSLYDKFRNLVCRKKIKHESGIFFLLYEKFKAFICRNRKKRVRKLSILISLILVGIFLYGFFSMIMPQLLNSLYAITNQFPAYIINLYDWTNKFLADNPDIYNIVKQLLDTYSEGISGFLNNSVVPQMEELVKVLSVSVINVIQVLWNFIIGLIIACYLLGSKELFAGQAKKLVYAVFKTPTANGIVTDLRFVSKTFIGFIGGKIVDSIIIGFICFAGMQLLSLPYPLLISVIIGVTNVIPFFGPYIGAIPSIILILMVNPIQGLYFAIFILILQQFDGNILGPKILGDSTGLSGFWVIFSITIFGGLFGISGMIIGVPVFAVLYAYVKRITKRLLIKRELPIDTQEYLDVDFIENKEFIRYDKVKKKSKILKGFKSGKQKEPDQDKHSDKDDYKG